MNSTTAKDENNNDLEAEVLSSPASPSIHSDESEEGVLSSDDEHEAEAGFICGSDGENPMPSGKSEDKNLQSTKAKKFFNLAFLRIPPDIYKTSTVCLMQTASTYEILIEMMGRNMLEKVISQEFREKLETTMARWQWLQQELCDNRKIMSNRNPRKHGLERISNCLRSFFNSKTGQNFFSDIVTYGSRTLLEYLLDIAYSTRTKIPFAEVIANLKLNQACLDRAFLELYDVEVDEVMYIMKVNIAQFLLIFTLDACLFLELIQSSKREKILSVELHRLTNEKYTSGTNRYLTRDSIQKPSIMSIKTKSKLPFDVNLLHSDHTVIKDHNKFEDCNLVYFNEIHEGTSLLICEGKYDFILKTETRDNMRRVVNLWKSWQDREMSHKKVADMRNNNMHVTNSVTVLELFQSLLSVILNKDSFLSSLYVDNGASIRQYLATIILTSKLPEYLPSVLVPFRENILCQDENDFFDVHNVKESFVIKILWCNLMKFLVNYTIDFASICGLQFDHQDDSSLFCSSRGTNPIATVMKKYLYYPYDVPLLSDLSTISTEQPIKLDHRQETIDEASLEDFPIDQQDKEISGRNAPVAHSYLIKSAKGDIKSSDKVDSSIDNIKIATKVDLLKQDVIGGNTRELLAAAEMVRIREEHYYASSTDIQKKEMDLENMTNQVLQAPLKRKICQEKNSANSTTIVSNVLTPNESSVILKKSSEELEITRLDTAVCPVFVCMSFVSILPSVNGSWAHGLISSKVDAGMYYTPMILSDTMTVDEIGANILGKECYRILSEHKLRLHAQSLIGSIVYANKMIIPKMTEEFVKTKGPGERIPFNELKPLMMNVLLTFNWCIVTENSVRLCDLILESIAKWRRSKAEKLFAEPLNECAVVPVPFIEAIYASMSKYPFIRELMHGLFCNIMLFQLHFLVEWLKTWTVLVEDHDGSYLIISKNEATNDNAREISKLDRRSPESVPAVQNKRRLSEGWAYSTPKFSRLEDAKAIVKPASNSESNSEEEMDSEDISEESDGALEDSEDDFISD